MTERRVTEAAGQVRVEAAQQRVEELRRLIEHHNYRYYVLDDP
jgi:NAD-dependent DNA ligase